MPYKNLLTVYLPTTILLLFITLTSSCRKQSPILLHTANVAENYDATYLHISHTLDDSLLYEIDDFAAKVDYTVFDILMLGGDLSLSTSVNNSTLQYVDSIFNFDDSNTLWSLGNHDYENLNLIQSYTNRPPYYSYTKNGICFLVLDTQDSMSNIIGAQKALFDQVLDTIQDCSHLIILHHKMIQLYGNPTLKGLQWAIPNSHIGQDFHHINPNNFYTDLYPPIILAKERGIEVICVIGDLGRRTSTFQYQTNEGIIFLGSGIKKNATDNKVLLFHHNIAKQKLVWEFVPITDLKLN